MEIKTIQLTINLYSIILSLKLFAQKAFKIMFSIIIAINIIIIIEAMGITASSLLLHPIMEGLKLPVLIAA
ncbi:MAG: hypothetical protein A2Z39_03545 [Deltaproteobacteria bacterium RBG_19FT_COMBO_46_9]|nr:MAG: hypothetical protein A2Z39_03545 [Deltaproteobacteria bacterium RBG_19FT_COMBO_46_9]